MRNSILVEQGVQCVVVVDENIVLASVDNNILAWLKCGHQRYYRVLTPHLLVALKVAKALIYLPSVGVAVDVSSPFHAAARAVNLGMAPCEPQRSMSTHAQTSDCTVLGVVDGAIVCLYIASQLFSDIGLKLEIGVDGRIKVPAVLSVGACYNNSL